MTDKQRTIFITIFIIIFGLVGYGIYSYIANGGVRSGGTITVDSVPSDLTLTLDGKKISSIGKRNVTAGTHTLVAKRANFTDKTVKFTIKKGEKRSFDMYLIQSNPAGTQWKKDNPDEAIKYEKLGGQEFKDSSEKAIEQNGLIQHLPFIGAGFAWRIDYGQPRPDAKYPGEPTILIQVKNDAAKESALQWIREKGFDPEKMNIVYEAKP